MTAYTTLFENARSLVRLPIVFAAPAAQCWAAGRLLLRAEVFVAEMDAPAAGGRVDAAAARRAAGLAKKAEQVARRNNAEAVAAKAAKAERIASEAARRTRGESMR
jgi:hypothetical protein